MGSNYRYSVSHSTPAILPLIFQNSSFVSSSGSISSTSLPVRLSKISVSDCFYAMSIAATSFIAIVGVGTPVKFPRVIFLPVHSHSNL